MRNFLILLLFCWGQLANAQNTNRYFSLEAFIDQEHHADSTYYPRLSMGEELKTKLSSVAVYPELAKRKKIEKSIRFKVTIDTLGKIKNLHIDEEANPMFDTNAIRFIMASNGYWSPAVRKNTKKEITITTFVHYSVFRSEGGLLNYMVSLPGLDPIVADSTKTSPPVLRMVDDNKRTTFYMKEKRVDGALVLLADQYGTVTVGFDVDTVGHLSNIALANSVSTELDEHALKFIRSSEGKWLPAIKDGQKRDAHVEFDLYYYQYTKSLINPGVLILSHAYDREEARKFFEAKDYKNAVNKLNKLRKYYIYDPEIFFMRGFSYLNLKEMEKACEDINYSVFLAEEYGYPATMNKEKITEFLNTYCNQEEKETVEGK